MNKLIPLLAFSVLLLVPVSQNVFADHPTELGCPPTGFPRDADLVTNLSFTPQALGQVFCQHTIVPVHLIPPCEEPYQPDVVLLLPSADELYNACVAPAIQVPHITLPDQCQGASFLFENHCFAEALSSMIGGELLVIDTLPLLVGAIGVNPVITGLVGITLAGITGQAVWFVHRRRKSENS